MKQQYKINTPSWYLYKGVYNEWKIQGNVCPPLSRDTQAQNTP